MQDRADAQRNREKLVVAARGMFADRGGKVALEAIARAAGVGIGTLYRHFPTREALVEAVYRAEVSGVCASAPKLLAGAPAEDALRAWMDRFADYVAAKDEMADALRSVVGSGSTPTTPAPVTQARAELADAVRTLLEAGAAEGTVRADVRAEDVVASLVGIFVATGPDRRDQAGRMMDLLMDGLTARTA
ncbi:TetR/AcrR family transcriptional regulator [Nocardia sp. BMG51109]|uniref:TetR/AcrR family transcriptional regulator n=1 Tax=Nocardia sp. BMG51109 TaxID=1056816 RepID=UPI000465AFDE|nr:TetR/AcrR family transcriptional regulator [Nocardia sp. BMG51109]